MINCEDFDRRMHECLDQRRPISGDPELAAHIEYCDRCRRRAVTWDRVESTIFDASYATMGIERAGRATLNRSGRGFAPLRRWATATIVIVAIGSGLLSRDRVTEVVAVRSLDLAPEISGPLASATVISDVDPVLWWHDVHQRDWIKQTMPTVRSVQEGVAPLGRSLMRAVTILTIGGSDKTS